MIDVKHPDYTNTPASDTRPVYSYQPREEAAPSLSIITPYYNTGPVFLETVRAIARMSFTHWEWLIIDDGSTQAESLEQLARVAAAEPRIRVIRQANGGPAVARNRAAREARGRYLLQVDSDDLIEPTFVEKALWVLETQPQFAACNSYNVTFGSKNFLWPYGFEEYSNCLKENWVTNQAVIRKEDFFRAGGYDESISYEHADWDFWLNLAEVGLWGVTIPEYLTWYRTQERSLLVEIESDRERAHAFRVWLKNKHGKLRRRFPHPIWGMAPQNTSETLNEAITVHNALAKPDQINRILLLIPWLEVGGADKFNLDLIERLSQRGYEFTVVTTLRSDHPWLSRFSQLTPDIFCLHQFLAYSDYPRFLNYLIDSRQIDAVLISNSELGYELMPYLRARHPRLALLDYTHSEIEDWKDGGYPGMAARLDQYFDLHLTNTHHLKNWMVAKGIHDPDRIQVCHCGIETKQWKKERYEPAVTRKRLGIAEETPIILFVGRLAEEKRPLLFAHIIDQLAQQEPHFVALMIGDGAEADALKAFIHKHRLQEHIHLLGALPSEEVRELMAAGDMLVLPSAVEGIALVLFEAMAMEIVPVAAAVGGQAELVTPECGYLIPHGKQEVEAYVEVLLHLLHHPQQRSQMGQRARQRVVGQFDIQQFIEGMDQAFESTCRLAKERPVQQTDLAVIQHSTYLLLEDLHQANLSDFERFEQQDKSFKGRLRRARQAVLPIGTRRYEYYKFVRILFRRAKRSMYALAALLKGREAPPSDEQISGDKEPSPETLQEVVESTSVSEPVLMHADTQSRSN
jgi:glycosyltransferase involved in cell wall biosynthesis